MSKTFIVQGYYRTSKIMRVVAETEEEAVQKAKEGDYEILDTDPDGDIYTPRWKAKLESYESEMTER